MGIETIITKTGLNRDELVEATEKLAVYGEEVELPITKKDKPMPGVYYHVLDDGAANVYTVRGIDVVDQIARLTDKERGGYCDKGYRIGGLHAPTHKQVKVDLGLVKPSVSSEKLQKVKEDTLNEVIQKLVSNGMSTEEATALILPKA